jgi:hypothetical protein
MSGRSSVCYGKPVVALVVHPTGGANPRKLRTALRESLAGVRVRLPDGLALDASFDFTANREPLDRSPTGEFLLLDLDMPAFASAEHTGEVLRRCEATTPADDVTKATAAEQGVEIITLPGVGAAGVWERTRTCDES